MQFYVQDAKYHHDTVKEWAHTDIQYGQWMDVDFEDIDFEGIWVAEDPATHNASDFVRDALPTHIGFSFATNYTQGVDGPAMSKTDPIKIDFIEFDGMVPVEKEPVIYGLVDFFNPTQINSMAVDYTGGVIVASDLTGKASLFKRADGFSWCATSWFGNIGANLPWDLTTMLNSSTSLTQRGDDIVNGKGGLSFYAPQPSP
jgi:hypothetical protein